MTTISLGLLVAALAVYRNAEPAAPSTVVLDEYAGSYRNVSLGATREAAVTSLGQTRRWRSTDPIGPRDDDYAEIGAPVSIAASGRPDALRYPHVSVLLDNGRVTAIMTAEKGARTRAGVSVGDSLREAHSAYPRLACGDRAFGEGGSFPYCGGRLAPKRWIWFGRDPIASITIASLEMD